MDTDHDAGDGRPHDLDAERAVLGAMMLDPDLVPHVAAILGPDDFYRGAHAEVFAVVTRLADAGQRPDPIAVLGAFSGPDLIRIGGAPYLHDMVAGVPTATNGMHYAEIVADRAVRARMLDAGHRITQLAGHGAMADTADVLASAIEAMDGVTRGHGDTDDDGVFLADVIDDELAAWDVADDAGISTGYTDLDEVTGGLRAGQFIIIAGRPGMGKSVLGTDWGRHVSECGGSVLEFSLEMSRRELMQRLVSAKAKVRLRDILQRTWTDHERAMMSTAGRDMRETVYRIVDDANITMPLIRAKARAMARSATGLDLLIVDYLQLMSSGRKVESRQQEVSEFSRGLKVLAKELRIPIVALSQLNRGPETRPDHRPVLADLRESGSLEQDADMVILLNRPDAWERDDPRAGEVDLHLAKNRNGPTTTVTMGHQLHYSRFADLARGPAWA